MTNRIRIVAAFALVLAACGAGDGDTADLPINQDPDSTPPAAGACLEDEPDCQDVGGQQAEPLPLPSDDEPGTDLPSDGMNLDPISVSDALNAAPGEVLAVEGFFFDDGTGPRLCDALAESFPPQCGEGSLLIVDFEEMIDVPIQNEQGVSWTDQPVTLVGSRDGDTLVVDPTISG